MQTFYEFLLKEQPEGAKPPSGTPSGTKAPEGGSPTPAGGLGGPPMGLGGPPMGRGGPPPGLGGMGGLGGGMPSIDASMGGPQTGGGQASVSPQKIAVSNVWQALEKIIKNKNGQNSQKMVNLEQI